MDKNKKILYLTGDDILQLNQFNIERTMEIVEQTFLEYANQEIKIYNKISQVFNEENQERINCLTAALTKYGVCGMKWVSVFPLNPGRYNLNNACSTILLSNLQDGYPIAIIDFSLGTAIRTAAVNAVAAKYLARKSSKSIGVIGSGIQAKFNFQAIKHVFPQINQCFVSSRKIESEERFVNVLTKYYPDTDFLCCHGDHNNAVRDADIVITATSAQEPLLKQNDIKRGALLCHIAGYEEEYALVKRADKIICDSWNEVKHRKQTISKMFAEGLIHDNDIYGDLHEIIHGGKAARGDEDEFIYFNSVGLPYLDIAIANFIYTEASRKGAGSWLPVDEVDLFHDDKINRMML